MNSRLSELDSIRGLAAVTVVIGHFFVIFPSFAQITHGQNNFGWENLFKYSPLHIFWSGHEAVILFFILSGFVLALPFYLDKPFSYPAYLIKRVCRIYLPYFCAVIIAFLLKIALYSGSIPYLSSWFNNIWHRDITWDNILDHLLLIGDFPNYLYNPVLWSLVHEMRISLIFPFIVLLIKRFHWGWSLSIGYLIYYLGFQLQGNSVYLFGSTNDYFITVKYSYMFIIGAVLAKHHQQIGTWLRRIHVRFRFFFLLFAITLYISKWLFYEWQWVRESFYNDLLIAVGGSCLLLIGLYSKRTSRFLLQRFIQFLGRISYSLYLYHVLILLSMIHLLTPYLPLWAILTITPFVIFGFTYLLYRYVEQPSAQLGRTLTKKKTKLYPSLLWEPHKQYQQKLD